MGLSFDYDKSKNCIDLTTLKVNFEKDSPEDDLFLNKVELRKSVQTDNVPGNVLFVFSSFVFNKAVKPDKAAAFSTLLKRTANKLNGLPYDKGDQCEPNYLLSRDLYESLLNKSALNFARAASPRFTSEDVAASTHIQEFLNTLRSTIPTPSSSVLVKDLLPYIKRVIEEMPTWQFQTKHPKPERRNVPIKSYEIFRKKKEKEVATEVLNDPITVSDVSIDSLEKVNAPIHKDYYLTNTPSPSEIKNMPYPMAKIFVTVKWAHDHINSEKEFSEDRMNIPSNMRRIKSFSTEFDKPISFKGFYEIKGSVLLVDDNKKTGATAAGISRKLATGEGGIQNIKGAWYKPDASYGWFFIFKLP